MIIRIVPLFALLCAGCATAPFISAPTVESHELQVPRAGGMTIASAWDSAQQLKPGMTEDRVLSILGAPDQKTRQPNLHWVYRWPVFIGYSLDLTFERRGGQWVLSAGNWWNR
jgi:hypothetical protein